MITIQYSAIITDRLQRLGRIEINILWNVQDITEWYVNTASYFVCYKIDSLNLISDYVKLLYFCIQLPQGPCSTSSSDQTALHFSLLLGIRGSRLGDIQAVESNRIEKSHAYQALDRSPWRSSESRTSSSSSQKSEACWDRETQERNGTQCTVREPFTVHSLLPTV